MIATNHARADRVEQVHALALAQLQLLVLLSRCRRRRRRRGIAKGNLIRRALFGRRRERGKERHFNGRFTVFLSVLVSADHTGVDCCRHFFRPIIYIVYIVHF